MAIKGLTDRGVSFPEIGQVRKGAPKGENRPGQDLKYFRVEFDEREQKAAATFRGVYGEKPEAIRIVLPFNEIERMWDAWLEAYTAGRMVARSDGERLWYLVDVKTGEVKVKNGEPYTPHRDEVGKDDKGKSILVKPTGRLKVIIPELARAAYLTVMTTSVHDIANISGQLEAFRQLNNGQIAGIPFILRRRPKKISVPRDGKRARMEKWLLSIEADPDWVKAKLTDLKRLALPGNGLALLPERVEAVELEEEEIITGEYVDLDDDEIHEEQQAEAEPEPVIEGEAEEASPTVFWATGRAHKIDEAILKAIVTESKNDWQKAMKALAGHIPPSK